MGGTKKVLTGGDQGFVSLKLDNVENVNHNTKKFRFKLPEGDMVSGLEVASAILTKFKPEGEGKPVLRPYTPVSDEGVFTFVSSRGGTDDVLTESMSRCEGLPGSDREEI